MMLNQTIYEHWLLVLVFCARCSVLNFLHIDHVAFFVSIIYRAHFPLYLLFGDCIFESQWFLYVNFLGCHVTNFTKFSVFSLRFSKDILLSFVSRDNVTSL